jgi:hypothetical protein
MFFLPEVLLNETVLGIVDEQVVTLLVKFAFCATDIVDLNVPTLPLRPHVRARTREGTSSASKWTGTRVPRNAGFPPMILPINRSLVGASGRAD